MDGFAGGLSNVAKKPKPCNRNRRFVGSRTSWKPQFIHDAPFGCGMHLAASLPNGFDCVTQAPLIAMSRPQESQEGVVERIRWPGEEAMDSASQRDQVMTTRELDLGVAVCCREPNGLLSKYGS